MPDEQDKRQEPSEDNETKEGKSNGHDQKKQLEKIAKKAEDVLVNAESIFPFVLFPDSIAVSRNKVVIIHREFFRVSDLISLQIEDILNVESDAGPFFGSLRIFTRIYGTRPLRITFLSRSSTIEVKMILEGLIIANMKNIDVTNIERGELLAQLRRLGSDKKLTSPV